MKDRITVFSINITIKIPLRFFAFRLCRCSTVKSRSKREKLSLKTLIIPRVRLAIEFGSFLFTQQFCPFSLTSGIATLTRTYVCFSRYYSVFAERLIKNGGISQMKKVVYSIRKVRNSNEKLSGLGFINDEGTLFCKCVSKNGKQYTRAFDDVDKHCFPVFGKENEYKGYVTMYYEYEGRDIEVEYSIWFKTV